LAILKSALVLGASGLVGRALLNQLLHDPRYGRITCLVRRPLAQHGLVDNENKLAPIVVDFDCLDEYLGYFKVDHVFCCLGTTMKVAGSRAAFRKVDFEYVHVAAQLASAQRAQSFVWVSAVGANAKSRSFYLRVKGELENSIMQRLRLSHASAVRPSLLLGYRQEIRLLEKVACRLALLLSPLMVGRFAKYRPVSAEQVAFEMIRLQRF
jgi:uncharacterized protein YbjT (DUF2867 family)